MPLQTNIARCTGETHRAESTIACPLRNACKRYLALVRKEAGHTMAVMSPPTPGKACNLFMESEEA